MNYGTLLMQQILNGLHIGSIYALIALGYTMVYGIVKLINFAHGDIMMVGAYIAFMMITVFNLPLPIAIIISMASCALIGMGIEKVAYKPLTKCTTYVGTYYSDRGKLLLRNIIYYFVWGEFKTIPYTFTCTYPNWGTSNQSDYDDFNRSFCISYDCTRAIY